MNGPGRLTPAWLSPANVVVIRFGDAQQTIAVNMPLRISRGDGAPIIYA
jgi:hypothetical protein